MNKVRFYCVIDFEATCEKNDPKDYVHEIIEFPAVLLDADTLEKVCKLWENIYWLTLLDFQEVLQLYRSLVWSNIFIMIEKWCLQFV